MREPDDGGLDVRVIVRGERHQRMMSGTENGSSESGGSHSGASPDVPSMRKSTSLQRLGDSEKTVDSASQKGPRPSSSNRAATEAKLSMRAQSMDERCEVDDELRDMEQRHAQEDADLMHDTANREAAKRARQDRERRQLAEKLGRPRTFLAAADSSFTHHHRQ